MGFRSAVGWLLAVMSTLGLAGCGPFRVHHAQTEVFVDGSVDRAVLQPLVNAPQDAFNASHWDEISYPTEKSFD